MKLFLAEHEYQVEDFLKRFQSTDGEWIALGPSAMWALDQRGIAYQIPEYFYNTDKLEDLCLKVHKRVEWLCNCLDEILWKQYPELQEWGMHPFLFHIFPFTILFDGLVSRIFQLRAVLAAYPKHKVWVHVGSHCPWDEMFHITFSNRETLWGQLLSIPGWDCEIELVKQPENFFPATYSNKFVRKSDHVLECLKRYVKQSFILSNAAKNIKSKNWKGLADVIGPKSKGLLFNSIYNWSCTIPFLRNQGWQIFFNSDQSFGIDIENNKNKVINTIINLIEKDLTITSCFESQGISFYPLLKTRLTWILENIPVQFQRVMHQVKRKVKKNQIKAILTATSSNGIENAVNQAGRYLGLPVFNWQHGFIIYTDRITQLNEFNDMMTSDVVLTFGKEVSKAYNHYSDKFPSDVVSVGSGSLDKIAVLNRNSNQVTSIKNNRNNPKRILYVTTNYLENYWYCGFSPPVSDRLFFKDQLGIMEYLTALVQNPKVDIELIVKLSPAKVTHDPPWVRTFLNNKRIRIIKDSPTFMDLLPESDIIIIDSPTTTVLQSISTQKPVFVLLYHIGYPDHARQMLRKRAICAKSVQTLMEALSNYLKTNNYSANIDDNEFLRAYGNYFDDGKSAERAAEVVDDYLRKNKHKSQKIKF